jgi:hypothetical protein
MNGWVKQQRGKSGLLLAPAACHPLLRPPDVCCFVTRTDRAESDLIRSTRSHLARCPAWAVQEDTADTLASEISENFGLSPTDTEICAAALREWLARGDVPGGNGGGNGGGGGQ